MQAVSPPTNSTRRLERILAVLAAAACLLICALIWQVVSAQQPMWPLPALYLLEMLAASILGVWDIWSSETRQHGAIVTWVAAGILLAFVILGAWSVGFLFIPVASLLAAAAVLSDRRQGRNLALHLGVGLGAAFVQAALMLGIIGLL
jgi:peptidoglycan/LPS O-acetylase OafA/YrhL